MELSQTGWHSPKMWVRLVGEGIVVNNGVWKYSAVESGISGINCLSGTDLFTRRTFVTCSKSDPSEQWYDVSATSNNWYSLWSPWNFINLLVSVHVVKRYATPNWLNSKLQWPALSDLAKADQDAPTRTAKAIWQSNTMMSVTRGFAGWRILL